MPVSFVIASGPVMKTTSALLAWLWILGTGVNFAADSHGSESRRSAEDHRRLQEGGRSPCRHRPSRTCPTAASETGARFLEGRIAEAHAAVVLHSRRRLGGRRQGSVGRPWPYLAAGISVVSIEYRFVAEAIRAGVKPPVRAAARRGPGVAVRPQQGCRVEHRQAAHRRVGRSAGACSSLWLAFHPDMADPQSADPVARESTRLWCAAVVVAQTTLDPQQMKEWTPNSRYGGHAFGFMPDPAKTQERDTVRAVPRPARKDPALDRGVFALRAGSRPMIRRSTSLPHAARSARPEGPDAHRELRREIAEKCRSVGVECELVYPAHPT